MGSSFYPSNDAEFALWLNNFIVKADANDSLLKLNADEFSELKHLKETFDQQLANKQTKQEESMAATAAVKETRQTINRKVGYFNSVIKTKPDVSISLVEELGLNAKDSGSSGNGVNAPSDLVVTGTSDGVNHLKWNRASNKQGTIFIIEAKIGDTGKFSMVAAVTISAFDHTDQSPGVKVLYRVKAKRGNIESNYTNEAIVYA